MSMLLYPFAWRYWSKNTIYTPLASIVLLSCFLRKGKPFFCTAANPKITMAGLANDSKYEVYKHIPAKYIPTTVLVPKESTWEEVENLFDTHRLAFPIFAKPDIGEGGLGVMKIANWEGLKDYYQLHHIDIILQNCIPYNMEFGVMVHDANGKLEISSLTERAHFQLIGDGTSSILALIKANKTYRFRAKKILSASGEDGQRVLAKGEVFKPISLGNWSYGATFIDRREWINDELTAIFQKMNDEIGMVHVGRYDILTPSFEAMLKGEFQIVEINGIKSELIHVFDPKYNYFSAYAQILKHWYLMYKISKRNVKAGAKPVPYRIAAEHMRCHFRSRKVDIPTREN